MAEYIERDKALREIDHSLNLSEAYSKIAEMPAADVVEVKHGRWEFDGYDFADIWKCSACGEDWYFEYDPRDAETPVKFCPDCGAKMDLEVQE